MVTHRATPGRYGPLYPGQEPHCPNGCRDFPQVNVMPADSPPGGWLGTCCASCGWTCRFHRRHGDRDQDVYWIVDEDVPPDPAALMRGHTLALLRRHGYPTPAWAE